MSATVRRCENWPISSVRYPTPQQVLAIHAYIVDKTGGSHGVRDLGLLVSSCERPKTSIGGQEMYPTIFEKAAVLLEALARYHVFLDGNKRTAFASSMRLLEMNGYVFTAENNDVVMFMLRVVEERMTVGAIASWLQVHAVK